MWYLPRPPSCRLASCVPFPGAMAEAGFSGAKLSAGSVPPCCQGGSTHPPSHSHHALQALSLLASCPSRLPALRGHESL